MNQQDTIKRSCEKCGKPETDQVLIESPHGLNEYLCLDCAKLEGLIAGYTSSLESKGLTRASDKLPPVGICHAFYNGDHVIFQVHDGGFRVINYHGEKEDSPKLHLVKWLSESIPSDNFSREQVEELLRQQRELCYIVYHADQYETTVQEAIINAPSPIK